MSKKKKSKNTLKVKYDTKNIDVKWEDLKELNLTIRENLKKIMEELKKLKATQIAFKIENEELDKVYKGILGTIKDIINDVEEVTELHSKKIDDKTIAFYKGPVNIDNNEFSLYTDILTAYTAINEKITVMQYTSILAYVTELNKALESMKKGDNNGRDESTTTDNATNNESTNKQ